MKQYISLLRGINVSGQKKVLMADLKSLYEGLGFNDVITYIQSGNVIFSSDLNSESELKAKLEQSIEEQYQFHVPVLVLSSKDFNKVLKKTPFKEVDLVKDGTKFLITFLSEEPAQDNIKNLLEYVNDLEQLEVIEQAVYLHSPNGYGRSKLSNTFMEKKLNVSATTRNLKTVHKLHDLINH